MFKEEALKRRASAESDPFSYVGDGPSLQEGGRKSEIGRGERQETLGKRREVKKKLPLPIDNYLNGRKKTNKREGER